MNGPTIYVDFDFVGQFACFAIAYGASSIDPRLSVQARTRHIARRLDIVEDCRKLWGANQPNEATAENARRGAKAIAGEEFASKACRGPLTEVECFRGLS